MTFKDYSEAAREFIPTKNFTRFDDMMLHAVFGMNSETGEVAGLFQKTYQGRLIQREHLKRELGDVLWFLNEAAIAMGLESLDEIAQINIQKLTARHHGSRYNSEGDLNREEGDV